MLREYNSYPKRSKVFDSRKSSVWIGHCVSYLDSGSIKRRMSNLKGHTRSDAVIMTADGRQASPDTRHRLNICQEERRFFASLETIPSPQVVCLRAPGLQHHSELTNRLCSTRKRTGTSVGEKEMAWKHLNFPLHDCHLEAGTASRWVLEVKPEGFKRGRELQILETIYISVCMCVCVCV